MPVCPKCSATIHTGANDLCPACGYSLHVADQHFGDRKVEFTRVVDSAGALTHQQRQELLHFLENLERDIPPAALCIYITDDGRPEEFRSHAHWILNHARIHHPSFGRREQHKALEDAELRLRFTKDKEQAAEDLHEHVPVHTSWLSHARAYLRDALHPHLPPPVNKAWMLILVLDVQLERACFSWGYQLDPYIDPDSINRCIVGAKFQFRERAMVTGLRRVMKSAVHEIAARSRRVNAHLRRTGRARTLAAFLAALLLLSPSPSSAEPEPTAPPPAEPAASPPADAAAEVAPQDAPSSPAEPAPTAESAAPAEPPPAPPAGAPATFTELPRWHDEDYRHLMNGELTDAYALLFSPADATPAAPRFRSPASPAASSRENDKKLPARYVDAYKKVSPAGLCDPQSLLTVEERRDVEHVLRELNANGRFRIFVTLYCAGQQLPPDLAVHRLTHSYAEVHDYATVLLFPLGNSQLLDLGYQKVNPSDEDRHEWLQRVRSAAAPETHGVDSLLLAIRELHAVLSPLSADFQVNSPENLEKLPPIEVVFRPDDEEKKLPFKDRLKAYFLDEANHPLIAVLSTLLLLLTAATLFFLFRRRSGHLIESEEDVRLSSPYGAGVSRYVRYLEGKESPKDSRIF